MKLQGRNLSKGLIGDDVKLLHFELKQLGFVIPDAEVARATFGDETLKVVSRFQTSNQLRPTGVVDEVTATAINRDFNALSLIQGQVRQGDALFTAGKVQAFDKDLRSEQLLGEAELSNQSRYAIRYSADKFSRAEKRLADLIVRKGKKGKKGSGLYFQLWMPHTSRVFSGGFVYQVLNGSKAKGLNFNDVVQQIA